MATANIDVQKLSLWAVQVLLTALVSLSLWLAKGVIEQIDEIDTRTKAVELWKAETAGNRFTAGDGAKIWESMLRMQAQIAANEPAVKETLLRLETTLNRMDDRLRAMEAKVKP